MFNSKKYINRNQIINLIKECQIIITDNIFNDNLIEKNDNYTCIFKYVTKDYVTSLLINDGIGTLQIGLLIDDPDMRCRLSNELNINIPGKMGVYVQSNKSDIMLPYDKIIIFIQYNEKKCIDYWMYGIKNKL